MQGPVFEDFDKNNKSPAFLKKSKQAKINKRRGIEDGPCDPTHYGGSMSNLERANRMANNSKGKKMPTAPEIFLETHGKIGPDGTRVLQLERDKEVYGNYQELRREAEEAGETNINDNELWFKATQPHNRGNVFGMGSAQGLLYDNQPEMRSRGMSTYVPGPYTRIEMELEEEKKKSNELYAWMEAQKKKEEAQEERERKREEQYQMMRTYFQNCNPGFQGTPH